MSELWIWIGLFGFVMTGVVVAGYYLVLRPSAARGNGVAAVPDDRPEAVSAKAAMARTLELIGEALPASEGDLKAVRKTLSSAGYRWPSAVAVYYGIKFAASVMALLTVGMITFLARDSLFSAAVAGLCAAGFAYKLLDRILFAMIRSRAGRIRRAMPAALDLLVLGVEAGQSLDQTIQNASRELEHVYPDLSSEFALTYLELQLGKSRSDALRRMAQRNEEAELRKVVSLLIEADRFGSSLGPVLRNHAKYLRIRMRQQAQEAARKVSVKLVFPVFFLIFPSVLIVTLGPAVLLLMEQLQTILGQ